MRYRNGFVADIAFAAAQFYEVPGIEGEKRQRHDLERRKHRRKSHRDVRLPGPVPVVSRADNAAAEIKNRVQVDHARRRYMGNNSQLIKDDRHHHGSEQLEEAFDPEMDNPEAPGIYHREMSGAVKEHRR